MLINQEEERTPMRGVACSNIDDEVSRGQEIQKMTYVACSALMMLASTSNYQEIPRPRV